MRSLTCHGAAFRGLPHPGQAAATPNPKPAHFSATRQLQCGCGRPMQPPARLPANPRQQRWHVQASVPAAPPAKVASSEGRKKTGPAALLSPFSDRDANAKLLALCTAQMLGSVATLMHEAYLPVYLSDTLGLSNSSIGGLQGTAQLLAKVSGSISGALADLVTPARMVLLGALLTAANKPMYAASGAVYAGLGATACLSWIAFAKIFDRVAKGIREAPSKALIGELATVSGDSPAAAFGLRQSMATLGAMAGALAASAAVKLTGRNYPLAFAFSTAPAVLALLLLSAAFGGGSRIGQEGGGPASPGVGKLQDASSSAIKNAAASEVGSGLTLVGKARALLRALRPAYWQALATVALLYMARFDVAFATLRAKSVMDSASLPFLIPAMMITQGALAAPIGLRARTSVRARNSILVAGIGTLVAANMCFACVPSVAGMVGGAFLLGLHMASTHGVSLAMLASYIPSHPVPGLGRVSGTAWSLTDLLLGVVLACSNWLAGRLSDLTAQRGLGGIGCFLGGATACTLSIATLLLFTAFGDLGREELFLPGYAQAGPAGHATMPTPAEQQLEPARAVKERHITAPAT